MELLNQPSKENTEKKSHQTLVILKPEVFEHNLIGHILRAFLDAKLIPIALEMKHPTKDQMLYHYRDVFQKYGDQIGKEVIERMTRGNSIFIVFTDDRTYSDPLDFILRVRKLIGSTDPKKAEPGTIRARFAKDINYNMVHASDSLESAADEVGFWFSNLNRSRK